MKSKIIGIIVVILVVFGIWFVYEPKVSEAPAVDENISGESFGMLALASGLYEIKAGDTIAWQGRKPLLNNYNDSGVLGIKSGEVILAEDGKITGEFVFDMNTIRAEKTGKGSGESMLTNHLKSADFFDVEKFPEAKFVITGVEANGEAGNYIAVGDLTIKGATHSVEFPINVTNNSLNTILSIKGQVIVDRSKYDVRFGSGSFFSDLGDSIIDDNFTVTLDLVAVIKK